MQPKQFRPRPNSFNEIRKKVLLCITPILILAVASGLFIAHANTDHARKEDVNVLPFMIPFAGILIFYSIYKTLSKQKELFESYTLLVEETFITRQQKGMPTITLNKWEIKEINKRSNGNLVIKGQSSLDCVIVPAQLENFTEAEALLSHFVPISNKPVSLVQQYSFVLVILSMGLLAAVFLLKDKILVTISGAVTIGLLFWSLYVGVKSKNVDQKSKKGLLWIGVIILAIIYRVVLVWIDSNLLK